MAEQAPGGAKAADEKGVKRVRGAFPRLPLSKVLIIPETIYQLGEGEQVRRRLVFDHLKKSAESSTSRAMVIASTGGYGLTVGGKNAVYLGLSDQGRKIVTAKSQTAKREAIYDLLFSNEIFSGIVERFNDRGIPLDDVAVEHLKNSYGLAHADAESAWPVVKENILEYGLYQELSGKKVIVSREHASKNKLAQSDAPPDDAPPPPPVAPDIQRGNGSHAAASLVTPRQGRTAEGVAPQFHFNIQVVLPDNAPAETYENIFRSIGTHLLGRDTHS